MSPLLDTLALVHPEAIQVFSHPDSYSSQFQFPLTANLNDSQLVRCSTYSNIHVMPIHDSSEGEHKSIAVKSLRLYKRNDPKVSQWIVVLKSLQQQHARLNLEHDNLEPFRIIYTTNAGVSIPAIVTSWHQNSDILTYVSRNPAVDKVALLRQLASAICYLHAGGVTHGNIYTGNVLITTKGVVRLADVSLSYFIRQHMHLDYVPVPATWMYKPHEELLLGTQGAQTDIYAFGSIVYTIYSLRPPYLPTTTAKGIVEVTTLGHRKAFEHSRPADMSIAMWNIIQDCWTFAPEDRPTMKVVYEMIHSL
ncbi:kinase-like protein [Athelia psychrophila]|uniref:Kinase-like protein n=1 Tax=Athelia psychrophila TaxID=1759441 RepID=A0A166DP84_9AGAM|nr:kinase-like protein [Fibularhizoctonia sp. CBS 109695]